MEKNSGKSCLALLLLCLAVSAAAEPRTLPPSWVTVASNQLATASVEQVLYERANDPHFYIRVRLTNTTNQPIGADLRDYWRVIYPNQWGISREPRREAIDERRRQGALLPIALFLDFADGKLTRLAPGEAADYYREFNASGRQDIEAQAQKVAGTHLVVSLDGAVPVTDGKRVEPLSCVWDGDRTAADTDLVIPLPVKWDAIPDGSRAVSEQSVKRPEQTDSAAQVLEPFYRNGWLGWPVGTEVRTTFLDDKVEGWYSYVQPDLVYRLTETALTRTQVVDGKPVVQQFDPANETGWQPSYLHKLPTAKTTPTTIEIDGVKIDCLLYESTMDHVGRDVGGTTVLKEWVLAAHPSTWLRTEANKNYKVIKSLRAMRQVGDRQVACVVVEERMELSGGHQISTTWLSPEVPGHVVEKISETWFEGRQHRTHERLAEARIPVPTSAVALIQALADSDNDHRAKAAAELRRLLAENPSAAPNRHDKTFWEQRLAQIQPGISQEEAIKRLLPDATTGEREQSIMGGPWSGQSGSVICRLDDYWTATIFVTDFENPKVMHAPALNAHVRSVWVKPPDNFTGRWTTYYVNGQKANEIEYQAGKYDGTFTAFHDDGSKAYQQHYKAGVCHGTDTGWHRNGQKAYEGIYEHGKQIGTWRWWDEAGKVTSEKTFTEPTP